MMRVAIASKTCQALRRRWRAVVRRVRGPVGAENRVTVSDQRRGRHPTSRSWLAGRPARSLAVALRLAYLMLDRVLSRLALLDTSSQGLMSGDVACRLSCMFMLMRLGR